ncbi:hydroxymethylglutaryl-CoA lyase [Advenella kashmirensis W13003]|uniref:Hydroxymethylglutaryl-CoA lyase n=1 Tax=Advenella kashmirensis W13003 TaxID=1424334 RepID=V8QXB0_9BURK|nr:hydroxymethylglutaryl-CoA lyase [Advenella kashmirensis]ETF04287.1 hydroxymethylglutaryl-CoA lyase [Advenella kashmirensis W13003]
MSNLPKQVYISEEGPREGFQIEKGPIPTADKVRFVEALAETGLKEVQCVSFVSPTRVPSMADAEKVAATINQKSGVRYTGLWLNKHGLLRAQATPLDPMAWVGLYASETFSVNNQGKGTADLIASQRAVLTYLVEQAIPLEFGIIMTAFGCNFEGDITIGRVLEQVDRLQSLVAEFNLHLPVLKLADTVGWANPDRVMRVIGAIRDKYPEQRLGLHLHDTRGTAMANAFAGLQMGVDSFDSSCAGLGGCPFAGHAGAAGNICTEDLAFMCEEMGISTGLDLDALVACAHLAEEIVGHPLPGKLMRGGTLTHFR